MVRKNERNPLLVGVCAKDALFSFKDCFEKKKLDGVSKEIHGVKLVCLEKDTFDFVRVKNEKDVFDLKVKEVRSSLEVSSSSPGVVICLGELKVLVEDDDDNDCEKNGDSVRHLVARVSELVELYRKKLWLIGSASNYETYSKFVSKFPSIEKDWDLHPLPITSSRSSFDALGSKSSLMGSFVPFGGFFSTPSDFKPQLTAMNRPFKRCNSCNEMYERELCSVLKEGSSLSVSDKNSASLLSWLQTADSDLTKGADILAQVKDMEAMSNEKIAGLQKKWDDHCQHLHRNLTFSAPGVSLPRPFPQPPHQNLAFHFVSDKRGGSSSSGDTSLTGVCSSSSSVARNIPSECHSSMKESPTLGYPIRNLSFPRDHKLSSSVPVTTDLGLGMAYGPKQNELNKPFWQDYQSHLQHSQQSKQTIQSSFLGGSDSGEVPDPDDYKSILQKLSKAVTWQCEAVSKISQIVSCRQSGNVRGGVWLSFLGPDKVGKRRVAEALADSVFGSKSHLVAVDFISRDRSNKADSLFICPGSQNFDINASRITVADHIAQELSKKPNSVFFLENIDEADPLVRNSLSRAIQTGKFQDSCGREVSIKNVIFVASTTTTKDDNDKTSSPRKEFIKFTEETILKAKSWQMKMEVRTVSEDAACISDGTRVSLVSPKQTSKHGTLSKRKALDHLEESNKPIKTPKNSLDLNLPFDKSEETTEQDICDEDFLSNGSRAWLDDFFTQTDGNVVFRPFEFDAQADKLLRKIRLKFEEVLIGGKMSLEIDYQVMVQILAAVWCSNNKVAVGNWIDQVLGECFVETRERYNITPESVVSLVPYVGVPLKNEWMRGICLPKSINLSV